MKVLNYLICLLAAAGLAGLRILPRRVCYRLTAWLGRCCYWIFPWQRNVIRTNLALAMPWLSNGQAQRIVERTFDNIGRVAFELAHTPDLRNKTLQDATSFIEVPEEILRQIRELLSQGKGLLYLTGHLGVWELLPSVHAITLPDVPLSIVVRPLDNPPLDRLINRYRCLLGNRIIPKKNSLRQILAALGRNETVGILLDQNVCREEGVFVDFFGKEACTNFGLAAVALRTDTPVLPIGLFYDEKSGRHRVQADPAVQLVRMGNKAEDLRANTAAFTRALQTMIGKHPDQWLWVHRRWKTRPKDREEKIYSKGVRPLFQSGTL